MRKIIVYAIFGFLMIILGVVIIGCSSNPLRKSEAEIRESILEITPIGMIMEDVIKAIESKEGWEIRYTFDFGYVIDQGRPREPFREEIAEGRTIGVKSIRATTGKYFDDYGFTTHVEIYWAFDEDGKLVDVSIKKETAGF